MGTSISCGLGDKATERARVKLTPEQIMAIEDTVARGDRVELVPVKDGIKILRVRRGEIKANC